MDCHAEFTLSRNTIPSSFLIILFSTLTLVRYTLNTWTVFSVMFRQGTKLMIVIFLVTSIFSTVHSAILLFQRTIILKIDCNNILLNHSISMVVCTSTIIGLLFRRALRTSAHGKFVNAFCLVWISVTICLGVGYYLETEVFESSNEICHVHFKAAWLSAKLIVHLMVLIMLTGIYFVILKEAMKDVNNAYPNGVLAKERLPYALCVTSVGIISTTLVMWNMHGVNNSLFFIGESVINSTLICFMLKRDCQQAMKEKALLLEKSISHGVVRVSTEGPVVFEGGAIVALRTSASHQA
ncbi:hypothetical protein BDF22DRAFT_697502, partial [Syncephalis plumigaleata]